jgi:hypothetical protein
MGSRSVVLLYHGAAVGTEIAVITGEDRCLVDLWGRLSNPSEAIETVAAQGLEGSHGDAENVESRRSTAPESSH